MSPSKPAHIPETESQSTLSKPTAVVGIVDQFYNESPSFTDQAVRFLDGRGISVKVHRDEEVNVELYRNLATYGYRLIILRVHAGVCGRLEGNPTFLFTAQQYTTGSYMFEQLTDQIRSGVLDPDMPENPVFAVGPMFVKMSMEGDFEGATIVLSSCLGLYTTHLADALVDRGTGAFISWDGKVRLEHTDEACMLLLKALIDEEMTMAEAVQKVIREVGPDSQYGCILKYYPRETSSLVLKLEM